MIRPLTTDDIPQIPRLLATEQGEHAEPTPHLRAVIENLLPGLFVNTPHADPELPGLVSVGDDGQLTGMIGRITRRMECRGRPIRAAVACELFVNPAHRSKMLGVKLLKKVMAGPHDLLFSDIANETSRKIWTGLGGSVASWYGLTWAKVLRPAQFALSMLRERRIGKLTGLAQPLAALTDKVLCRASRSLTQLAPLPNAESEPLTPERFLELFPQFCATDELRPVYDRETIDWIWPRLDFMYAAGPSEPVLVKSPRGEPLGWHISQMTDGRIVRVSQIVAMPNTMETVLDHLLHQAAERGAVAVSGRIIPRFLQAFADRNCLIRRRSTHTLIHSPDREVLDSFVTGRAFLSLFESEGPLQIWIKSPLALERLRSENTSKPVDVRMVGPISVEHKQSNFVNHAARVFER
ncbi:MAG: GNAT family N-acetyltransferase [Planctomycetaceae bacterium]|nr:GNAT family N-acetyltransferase [Planctomycetaceae bacterium]